MKDENENYRRGAEDAEAGEEVARYFFGDEDEEDLSDEMNELTRRVIGAAIEVHRHLGPGWLEGSYESALAVELGLRGIPFQRQVPVDLLYKGHRVGVGVMDLMIDGRLIVELKAVAALSEIHRAQCIAYLRASGLPLCLLINFNCATLKEGIRRIACTRRPRSPR